MVTESPLRGQWVGAGTGIAHVELERLWRRPQPLVTSTMSLDVPPPRTSRFGSPLVLSRVHWVQAELVAEVKFLTGPMTTCYARWSTKACARTNPRLRSAAAPHAKPTESTRRSPGQV